MTYFEEIFELQHTDITQTKNENIVHSNTREKTII